MFGVTVRGHAMVAHSFQGAAFGPAQALHGATYVVDATFRGGSLDPDGVLVDIGRATEVLGRVLDRIAYRNLDEHDDFTGANSTSEVVARWIADRLAEHIASGDLDPAGQELSAVLVTVQESPTAWVSCERRLGQGRA